MKLNSTDMGRENASHRNTFGGAGMKSGKRILEQIGRAKGAIFAEAGGTLKVPDRMLRLALNEAEALAWQTWYPLLVFPALAAEKVRGVAAWNQHQQWVGGQTRSMPF